MSNNKRQATYAPNLGPIDKPKPKNRVLMELQDNKPARDPICQEQDKWILKDMRRFKNYVRGALIIAYFVLGGQGVIIWGLLQDR